ncbi:flagellar export chaperone FliS [Gilvimarinus agarilyticus]|uniref:flagellar export chaperone FliS n=1 Tax=unclassified Gilvimarinus TaxID=2642066 RepID=UPI001C08188B|nr:MULTISPECIES: flagellar export chaperone FliS [unclassified Gilvimarinus]MBU2887243.1 flagellar export chaperone FliS [Gilvimarinus agarilyticus]MDO6571902.1 flagellar export chaperone FliS [Gilvimarinus sp. 2_MG-2023]MDO6745971.1 flagellar export chaperone FliS [Gilvimarinus sp. 1_MG-2023]
MVGYSGTKAASQYRKLGLEVDVNSASPHRLIQLLFEGALTRLQQAEVSMTRADYASSGALVGRVIEIVAALRHSLDEQAGELANQLDSLYQYCEFRLFDATRDQNPELLQEVGRLLKTLKAGWDGIATEGKA